jgi:hypothetical protein
VASCTTDDSCPETACLPDGTCAAAGTVLRASPSGTGEACTSDAKCSLATAIEQARPTRHIIRLDPVVYPGAISIDHSVQIIGRGATLEGSSAGAAVTVTNEVTAELDYLSITGASGGSGVSCASGTLVMHLVKIANNKQGIASACVLKLDRSLVTGNDDGALSITAGNIDIRNNVIVNNGNPTLNRTANVLIAAGVTGSFTFNTVAYNDAKKNSNPGVDCVSTMVNGDGNIVTNNTRKGMPPVDPQVSGGCDFTRSYVVAGTGNNDLNWVNTDALDFHLTMQSTLVLDSRTLSCKGWDDLDGQARPIGELCDFGADELKP